MAINELRLDARAADALDVTCQKSRSRSLLREHQWPLILTLAVVVAGMGYMFGWNPLVHRGDTWATGGDLWGIFRAAHYVGWGDVGGIYAPGNGVVAFPGMALLLAPVAMLAGHLNMTETYGQWVLARPTAALVLMPIELLLCSTVIFAADALARSLDVARRRRIWLCVVVAIVAWPTAAVWGHAEDALAMTFAIYAMVAMRNEKWARMGWLLGFGIVMQPLVALLLPLFVATTPRGQRFLLAIRSAAISVVLVSMAFAGDAADTYRQLVNQPTPPSINHATPWASLSPRLNSNPLRTSRYTLLTREHGRLATEVITATGRVGIEVAGGPGRMIDVALALVLAVFVWRRPQSSIGILWLAAAVLASRCIFEPVMTPYYLAPPLFLGLIMVARLETKRFVAASVLALEVTVFAYHHLNPWVWWLPIVASLIGILALGYPGGLVIRKESTSESASTELSELSSVVELVNERREPALI
jgi:hypothetical protein